MLSQRQDFEEVDVDGFPNGCLPSTPESEEVQDTLQSSAVSFSQIYESGDMPVIKWDGELEDWLLKRAAVIDDMNFDNPGCMLPWNIANRLGISNLYYSQESWGCCVSFGFTFAYLNALLQNIALGGEQKFQAINPAGTYVLYHGGKIKDGANVSSYAKIVNETGNFLVSDIGEYQVKKSPLYSEKSKKNAKEHQSGICFITGSSDTEVVDKIVMALNGGLSVNLGNSVAVNGSQLDKNGMPVVRFGGTWKHDTHFSGSITDGGEKYYGWINSHGKRYKTGKYGETGDGAYMTASQMKLFLRSAAQSFGSPVIVFAESKK